MIPGRAAAPLPPILKSFLETHPEALVVEIAVSGFERRSRRNMHPGLSGHEEGPYVLRFDAQIRESVTHTIRAALIDDAPTHVSLELPAGEQTMSAIHLPEIQSIVLVFASEGFGDPVNQPARNRQPVLSVTCDLGGEIRAANDAFLRAVESNKTDVIGRSMLDFLPGDDPDVAIQAWLDAISSGMATRRLEMAAPGGPRRWYQATTRVDDDRATVLFVDVTDDVRSAERLEERERDIRRMAETVPLGIFRATADGSLLYQNSRLRKVLGLELKELEVLPLDRVKTLDGRDAVEVITELLADSDEVAIDVRLDLDEDHRVLRLRIRGFEDDGEPQVVGSAEDITADVERREALRREALTDPVTGVLNRRALEKALADLLDPDRYEEFAVLLVDLDGFKQVNDTLGHDAGDSVIAEVSRRLTSVCRADDLIARLGGDEFVIVCEKVDGDDIPIELAERILPMLRHPYVHNGSTLELSASIGVAVSRPDLTTLGLMQMADHAMYEAKRAGRNQVKTYHSPDRTGQLSPLALRRDLRQAISADELELVFQPIFELQGERRMSAVEALLRWDHPTQGVISPGLVIPVAEQSGLIRTLGEWVISNSFRSVRRLGENRMSVNISAIQLGRKDFATWISDQLDACGLTPGRIVFELTESYLVDQVDHARETLFELHELGITLAVDDFGTGYSTFDYLLSLPVSVVKIDPLFTHRLLERRAAAMLRGLASACRSLDMSVIVEGVENRTHYEAARAAGATHAQGFHLARPLPLAELENVPMRHVA